VGTRGCLKGALLSGIVIASLLAPMLALTNMAEAQVPWIGTAVFSLENLWAVRLEKNLDIYQGSKLVVKFYTYAGAFEGENVVETFSPPWHVEENEIVPHPQGEPVENAELVLTDNTGNVISTIAFTSTRSVLMGRVVDIYIEWPFLEGYWPLRDVLNGEITAIYMKWAFAPY